MREEAEYTDIVLTGVPNVGKSTLFNALTGGHRRTGNYHGVTVDVACGKSRIAAIESVYDLPGTYSLGGGRGEENIAVKSIEENRTAVVVQIIDAQKVGRSMPLFRDLVERNARFFVAFTMEKKLRKRGGFLDLAAFSKKTGVPCVFVDAKNKKSLENFAAFAEAFLKNRLKKGALRNGKFEKDCGEKYALRACAFTPSEGKVNRFILTEAEYIPPKVGKHGFDALLSSVWLLPLFFLLTAGVFYAAFGKGCIGVRLKESIEAFFSFLSECAGRRIKNGFLKNVLCGGVIGGAGNVLSFLPQIAILYLFSDFLEESGVASALSYATDGLFSLAGLSGRAAFCVFLGYGCTAAGIAASASLDDRKARSRAIACLYYVPCSAKLPVYLVLLSSLMENAFAGAAALYVLGTGMGIFAAAFYGGAEEDFIMEIADFCIPSPVSLLKNLHFRLKGFIIKVSTTVLTFSVIAYALSSVNFFGACSAEESFLATLSKIFVFLFYPMGVRDWRAAFAAFGGILAKENVVGLLFALCPEGLAFSKSATAAYLVFVALIPPCIAAIGTAKKEIGGKTATRYAAVQTAIAFLSAYCTYFVLSRGGGATIACLCLFAAAIAMFVAFRAKKRRRARRAKGTVGRNDKTFFRINSVKKGDK